jgi:hypothetical protein
LSTIVPAAPDPGPSTAGPRLATRAVLASAWSLFQVSLPGCLPLAVLAVAASDAPRAEAHRQGMDLWHTLASAQGLGLFAVSTVLLLICYAGILRQQLACAAGRRCGALQSLRESLAAVLPTLGLYLLLLATVVPGLILVLPGLGLLVLFFLAWVAQIEEQLSPLAAIRRSVALVRGRFWSVATIVAAVLAMVVVFTLLVGILLAVVMYLAGQGDRPEHAGLSLSRWLMACIVAVPVVYVGAVSVATWRAAVAPAGEITRR